VGEVGILIDLQDLNWLALNEDQVLVTGPGNRWKDIYQFLENHDLGAVGGRHREVGVPGYLLGGQALYVLAFLLHQLTLSRRHVFLSKPLRPRGR
jgi:hypothetical protein